MSESRRRNAPRHAVVSCGLQNGMVCCRHSFPPVLWYTGSAELACRPCHRDIIVCCSTHNCYCGDDALTTLWRCDDWTVSSCATSHARSPVSPICRCVVATARDYPWQPCALDMCVSMTDHDVSVSCRTASSGTRSRTATSSCCRLNFDSLPGCRCCIAPLSASLSRHRAHSIVSPS